MSVIWQQVCPIRKCLSFYVLICKSCFQTANMLMQKFLLTLFRLVCPSLCCMEETFSSTCVLTGAFSKALQMNHQKYMLTLTKKEPTYFTHKTQRAIRWHPSDIHHSCWQQPLIHLVFNQGEMPCSYIMFVGVR